MRHWHLSGADELFAFLATPVRQWAADLREVQTTPPCDWPSQPLSAWLWVAEAVRAELQNGDDGDHVACRQCQRCRGEDDDQYREQRHRALDDRLGRDDHDGHRDHVDRHGHRDRHDLSWRVVGSPLQMACRFRREQSFQPCQL